ncbi:MAG: ORF6N domain-containing protein [Bacteroidota bacterium]
MNLIHKNSTTPTVTHVAVVQKIYLIRGRRVMLDRDLAELYGYETKRLNEQVKRNQERFPEDFMFQLTPQEVAHLRSQFATANLPSRLRTLPYAFTEHGLLMLANVLRSPVAIDASVNIVKVFIKTRNMIANHRDLQARLDRLEGQQARQSSTVQQLYQYVKLLAPKAKSSPRKMGFRPKGSSNS